MIINSILKYTNDEIGINFQKFFLDENFIISLVHFKYEWIFLYLHEMKKKNYYGLSIKPFSEILLFMIDVILKMAKLDFW